jgi:hypothetical protein
VSSPRIKMDNMSAIALSKNLMLHDKSKHIKTRYHFIRVCGSRGSCPRVHRYTKSTHRHVHEGTGQSVLLETMLEDQGHKNHTIQSSEVGGDC